MPSFRSLVLLTSDDASNRHISRGSKITRAGRRCRGPLGWVHSGRSAPFTPLGRPLVAAMFGRSDGLLVLVVLIICAGGLIMLGLSAWLQRREIGRRAEGAAWWSRDTEKRGKREM